MKTALQTLLAGAICFAVAGPALQADDKAAAKAPIYELRIYTTAEGRLPALHKRFRDHTVALFKKHGMTNVVYWTPADQKNKLVYLLKHDSVAARKKSFDGFRNDPAWKKAFKASRQDGPIVTKVQSTYLTATDYSPKDFKPAKKGWIYELRQYTTREGRLKNLHARFRDHTMKLFEKHGMHNALYTTPLDERQKDNTLVYIIAHKGDKAAKASWKAFGGDPTWKKARAASVADGPILQKGGVKRMYLKTTDYSPVK